MILHEACQYEATEGMAENNLLMVESGLSMGLALSRDLRAKGNFAYEIIPKL